MILVLSSRKVTSRLRRGTPTTQKLTSLMVNSSRNYLVPVETSRHADTFFFKKDKLAVQLGDFAKRSRCLGFHSQLWDSVGLVLPVAIKFRIDLQELWSSGYNWDEILRDSTQRMWLENLQTMNHLPAFEFDQELKLTHVTGGPQVHGFSDGGEQAYGCSHFPSIGVK